MPCKGLFCATAVRCETTATDGRSNSDMPTDNKLGFVHCVPPLASVLKNEIIDLIWQLNAA